MTTASRADHDVVVIGSGFGGAISALRLAEAGRSVLVLERGRRWAPDEFPRDVRDTDTLLWRYPRRRRATGLFDFRTHAGISTATAAGVGGGSLIYASIHYRPLARIFDDPRWPAPFTLDALDPYFTRVGEHLGVAPVPAELDLPKRDAFHQAAATLGRRVMDTPQAVSWTQVHGAAAERRTTCQLCCECEFGCTYGAKNTLDFTYLAQAEDQGAHIAPGCLVDHIAPGRDGGWEVRYIEVASGRRRSVVGRRVVVAAGTLGTNEILLRSRDVTRTLPKLPHWLGMGYSGNGDFVGNIQNATVRLDPWVGPDVTSVMWHDDEEPPFVVAAPTFNRPVMEVLASLGQPSHPAPLVRAAAAFWRHVPALFRLALARGLMSRPLRRPAAGAGPAERMTTVFAIGLDNAGGRLLLRRGELDIAWDYAGENRTLVDRQRRALQDLADAYGGTYADLVLWELFGRTMTVHSLGGCALSEDPHRGVVGIDGQVHGHAGLYVADGSVIPTAIGSHPVMTISAVAEWIADHIVDDLS